MKRFALLALLMLLPLVASAGPVVQLDFKEGVLVYLGCNVQLDGSPYFVASHCTQVINEPARVAGTYTRGPDYKYTTFVLGSFVPQSLVIQGETCWLVRTIFEIVPVPGDPNNPRTVVDFVELKCR